MNEQKLDLKNPLNIGFFCRFSPNRHPHTYMLDKPLFFLISRTPNVIVAIVFRSCHLHPQFYSRILNDK